MIYTIMTVNNNKVLVKTGRTDNLNKRMNDYITHGLSFELIDFRDGGRFLEQRAHKAYAEANLKRVTRKHPITGKTIMTEFFEKPEGITKQEFIAQVTDILNGLW